MNDFRVNKWTLHKQLQAKGSMSFRESVKLVSTMDEKTLEDHRILLKMERTNNENGN